MRIKKTLLQQYVDEYGYWDKEGTNKSLDLWSCIIFAGENNKFVVFCMENPELRPLIVETWVRAELDGRKDGASSEYGVLGTLEKRVANFGGIENRYLPLMVKAYTDLLQEVAPIVAQRAAAEESTPA